MCVGLHVGCRLFLSDCTEIRIFSIDFIINTQMSNLMKTRRAVAEVFNADERTDGLTDMNKANNLF